MESARMAPLRLTVVLCLLLASGCAVLPIGQDARYQYVNRKRASAAWKQCFSKEKRRCLSIDFECGFKAGFFDTATGKDCRLPAVPPSKYFAARYQCCEGQTAVQDWFRGYQSGIMVAQGRSLDVFNDVPVSPHAPVINQTGCGLCMAGDPCQDCGCGPVAAGPGIIGCNPCGTGHRIHPGNDLPVVDSASMQPLHAPVPMEEEMVETIDSPSSSFAPATPPVPPAPPVQGEPQAVKSKTSEIEAREFELAPKSAPNQRLSSDGPAIAPPPMPINDLTSRKPLFLEKRKNVLKPAAFSPEPSMIGGLGAEPQFALVGPSDTHRLFPKLREREVQRALQRESDDTATTAESQIEPTPSAEPEEGTIRVAPQIIDLH